MFYKMSWGRCWQSASSSEGGFSLIFDETKTNHRQKQMDLFLRFWNENTNYIVVKYIWYHFTLQSNSG